MSKIRMMSALVRPRQEDCEVEASVGYIVRPCFKKIIIILKMRIVLKEFPKHSDCLLVTERDISRSMLLCLLKFSLLLDFMLMLF
jgi:hypothetical protein